MSNYVCSVSAIMPHFSCVPLVTHGGNRQNIGEWLDSWRSRYSTL